MSAEPFAILYGLRTLGSWGRLLRDRRRWGLLYIEAHSLDDDVVVLVFRPAPDARWRAWEEVRKQWILGEVA